MIPYFDNTSQLWDSSSGQRLSEALPHGKGDWFPREVSPDGRLMAVNCSGRHLAIWEVPPSPLPVPEWLPDLAEGLAGQRFNRQGLLEPVRPSELWAVQQKMAAWANAHGSNATADAFYARWAKWFVADARTRTVLPSSPLTLPQYASQLIEQESFESVSAAVRLAPTNHLALARLASLYLLQDEKANPRAKNDAAWLAKRALELEPLQALAVNDEATGVAVDGSGNVFVTGSSIGSGGNSDYATIKYSGAGAALWTSRYDGPGNGDDIALAVAVDGSGNVLVTGYSASNAMVFGTVLVWLAILSGGWLGWQSLRQNGRILLRLDDLEKRLNELEFGGADEPEGLPVGSAAPDFELPDLAGEPRTLAEYRDQPLLLIFFNPTCGFCREMAPKLAALPHPQPLSHPMGEGGRRPGEGSPLLVITTGDAEKNRQFFSEHKVTCPVLLQNDSEVATTYQANGTPTGYLISAEGKIASELAVGADALLALAHSSPLPQPLSHPMGEGGQGPGEGDRTNRFSNRSVTRSKIKRDGLKAGTPAPDFRLPRLDGSELTLDELRGRRVLLVFSSPHCGPCDALAPQVEKFHRKHPELAVVMISRGEPKENRAKVKEHGLTFPVVLQHQWEISRRYAMFATPVAYLIDEAGIISADVAVEAEPILAMMGTCAVRFTNRGLRATAETFTEARPATQCPPIARWSLARCSTGWTKSPPC